MARESTIGSVFYLEDMPASAGATITAATAAAKAVITATHSLTVGQYVRISGTGMKSLDRLTPHRVSAVTTTTGFTVDTDSTGDIAATAGSFIEIATTEVCFAEFGVEAAAPGEVDVTTMCDTERKNVAGLSSPGSATFGGPLDMEDEGQLAVINAYNDGLARSLIWVTRGGQTGMMFGVVSSFAAAPQGVEQAVTFNGSFQIQDAPAYLPPLA